VAVGTPEQLAATPNSYTGQFLRPLLGQIAEPVHQNGSSNGTAVRQNGKSANGRASNGKASARKSANGKAASTASGKLDAEGATPERQEVAAG
jgi:excinuclease ABC subunit A